MELTTNAARHFEMYGQDLDRNFQTFQESSYQAYFSLCQKAIIEAVGNLKNTALIFGAGGLKDIPARELALQFDCVILVDINLTYTKIALERLPSDLQQKFSLMQWDLTGIFSELSAFAEKAAAETPLYLDFVTQVLDALPTFKRKGFELPNVRPSFVCSSLLASQLSITASKYLDKLSNDHYRRDFNPLPERTAEYMQWIGGIQASHVEDLHRLVDREGRVFFADHFSAKSRYRLKSKTEERTTVLAEAVFAEAAKAKTLLEERFMLMSKKEWEWTIIIHEAKTTTYENESEKPVSAMQYKERVLAITALTLSPK